MFGKVGRVLYLYLNDEENPRIKKRFVCKILAVVS